jgi:hypothetical protein
MFPIGSKVRAVFSLTPDNPEDGPVVPAGSLGTIMSSEDDRYFVVDWSPLPVMNDVHESEIILA